MTAEKLSVLLAEKQISSVELTGEFISKIKKENAKTGAYITVCEEKALSFAKRADEKIARGDFGAVTGIPYSVKDNICTAKIRTTCASKMLSDYVPTYDATVCEKLSAAGAVMLGKANLDEFGMGSFGDSSAILKTENPKNHAFVPGGSSSGSAASVAAGLASFSIGTDTGGSVRVPASFCGICGFKPSYGAVSRFGLIAYASSLDTVGPITRTIGDALLVSDVIFGRDSRDMTSVDIENKDHIASLSGMNFAFCDDDIKNCTHEIQDATKSLVALLLKAGGRQIKKSAFRDGEDLAKAYMVIASAEAMSNLARYDGIKYGGSARDVFFGAEVLRRIEYGNIVLKKDNSKNLYDAACKTRQKATERLYDLFGECDIVISPLCDFNVPKLEATAGCNADKFTVLANFAKVPAITLPIGRDKNGMPISVQIMAPRFSDYKLLSISKRIEELLRKEEII